MAAAGLPSPANYKIESAGDLASAAATVGFPAVLKPLSGAASLGVKKVESEGELVGAYDEVMAEMRETVVTSGALVKRPSSGSLNDMAALSVAAEAAEAAGDVAPAASPISFLLEAYLDGSEVVVTGDDNHAPTPRHDPDESRSRQAPRASRASRPRAPPLSARG